MQKDSQAKEIPTDRSTKAQKHATTVGRTGLVPQPTPTGHLATSTPVSRAVGATDPAAGVATSGAVRITVAASADASKAIALALVAGSVESVVGAKSELRSG